MAALPIQPEPLHELELNAIASGGGYAQSVASVGASVWMAREILKQRQQPDLDALRQQLEQAVRRWLALRYDDDAHLDDILRAAETIERYIEDIDAAQADDGGKEG